MIEISCEHCGHGFNIEYPSQVKRRRFCSLECWHKWLKARPNAWTESKVISELKEVAGRLGQTPRCNEVAIRVPLRDATRKFFGSWNGAIIAAGLLPNKVINRKISKDDIIETIQTQHTKNGRVPRARDQSRVMQEAAKRVFGSWAGALSIAGLKPASWNKGRKAREKGVLGQRAAKQLLLSKGYQIIREGKTRDAEDYLVKRNGYLLAVNTKYGQSWHVTALNLQRLRKKYPNTSLGLLFVDEMGHNYLFTLEALNV